MMLNRRDVLQLGVSAATASVLAPATADAGDDVPRPFRIVDTNVNLFHWPFRRLPLDEPDALVRKLRALGIDQAWVGSFEGLLHRDLAGVNGRLSEQCARVPDLFLAIGSVNPELPNWEQDLLICRQLRMPGIRLHPNYHGYSLDDARFARLLEHATAARQFVQIAAGMEDVRTQHPLLRVPEVDLIPLVKILPRIPGVRVQLLNVWPTGPLLEKLAEVPGLYFDTARVEGTDGVPNLVRRVPTGRVLFGTHAPFLIPEAALIRAHESGQLEEADLRSVLSGNSDSFLAGTA